jgi:hypothetical protein
MISEVSLSVQFRVTPKLLEIEYLVTNKSSSEIYLVDLAAQLKPEGITIRPSNIEITLAARDEITLSSKLFPVSSNILYAVPPDVYTSALKPSEVKRSMFTVPLPIKLGDEKEVKSEVSLIQNVIKSAQPPPQQPPPFPTQFPTQNQLNITKVIFILGVIDDVSVSRIEVSEAIPYQKELKVDSIVSPPIPVIIGESTAPK